ncbi:hypothetical protein ACFCZ1_27035 [Streptomyces sp. NPDC056224]|uniref:hypothetical protein n=1 Tax=Streptomyces sp. NPDC056224 TaxID=3345750 RepID=UPI0035D7586C
MTSSAFRPAGASIGLDHIEFDVRTAYDGTCTARGDLSPNFKSVYATVATVGQKAIVLVLGLRDDRKVTHGRVRFDGYTDVMTNMPLLKVAALTGAGPVAGVAG